MYDWVIMGSNMIAHYTQTANSESALYGERAQQVPQQKKTQTYDVNRSSYYFHIHRDPQEMIERSERREILPCTGGNKCEDNRGYVDNSQTSSTLYYRDSNYIYVYVYCSGYRNFMMQVNNHLKTVANL